MKDKNKKQKEERPQGSVVGEIFHGLGDGMIAAVTLPVKCVGKIVKCAGENAGEVVKTVIETAGDCAG